MEIIYSFISNLTSKIISNFRPHNEWLNSCLYHLIGKSIKLTNRFSNDIEYDSYFFIIINDKVVINNIRISLLEKNIDSSRSILENKLKEILIDKIKNLIPQIDSVKLTYGDKITILWLMTGYQNEKYYVATSNITSCKLGLSYLGEKESSYSTKQNYIEANDYIKYWFEKYKIPLCKEILFEKPNEQE